jgi:hypothetical protein
MESHREPDYPIPSLMPLHRDLSAGRWHTLTLAEQLAHVGSEVDRAIRSFEGARSERFRSALVRALELFDLTAKDDRWRGARRREILRLREEFCRLFFDDPPPGSAESLRRFFLRFAILARRQRHERGSGS